MRTTVSIDDELLAKAQDLTGIAERSLLLREGLKALISIESGNRLARLAGSQPELEASPRRREPAD